MASFTLTGQVHDHEDNPVARALVRAVPNPGVGVANNVTYDSEIATCYTDATGSFRLSLITYSGLYYTVDVSLGGTNIASTTTFAAPAAGSSIDLSTVVSLPQVPAFTGTVSSQWVLDQIKAEKLLQLGIAAAL